MIDPAVTQALSQGPLAGCTSVLHAVLSVDSRAERIACLLSDLVLARALSWSAVLPVTAQKLTKTILRNLASGGRVADFAIQARLQDSLQETVGMARDLACRAAALQAVAPKLRAKGSEAAVALFLSEDAVAPSTMLSPMIRGTNIQMTDRAARRFCDRLVELGVACELRDRAADVPALWDRAMTAVAQSRKTKSGHGSSSRDCLFDRELEDLPQELRWREWMGRIEAVLFASASAVGHDDLARVVGQGASVELLIADIEAELKSRPYELVQVAGGWMFPHEGPVRRSHQGGRRSWRTVTRLHRDRDGPCSAP